MYPWRTVIGIKRRSEQPVFLQIANIVIGEIHSGRLAPGQKLPGTRTLSQLLSLNRKTVVEAIDELSSQGWVESYPKKGTFVSAKLPKVEYKRLPGKPIRPHRANGLMKVNDQPCLEPLHLDLRNKKLIDDGVPDVRLAPLNSLFKHHRPLLSRKVFTHQLTYNDVEGDPGLRSTLTSYLQATRGIHSTSSNIFITRGSQMGIYLTIATLVKKGDTCITSFPGYQIVDSIIAHVGGEIENVRVDESGLVTADIENLCKRKRIKLIYVTPHHHYPTTVTLSPARRVELLQLAIRYNFYILEDDYDYDFHYDNNPVLPLASLNTSGHVIYIGSFSKCLAPVVRVGYFVARPEIVNAANKLRRVIDRQGDPLLERSLSEFIKTGEMQRHLKKTVKIYRQRRDLFCRLLGEYVGDHVRFSKPEGGMSVWVTFKKRGILKTLPAKLAREGYLLETDNIFISKFNAVRMGFASMTSRETVEFMSVLKKVLEIRS